MKVVRQKDLKANIRQYFDMAFDGEAVVVPRKENRNVVIISEDEYRQLEKARNNLEYLLMLRKSEEQIRSGRVVVKRQWRSWRLWHPISFCSNIQ